MSLSRMYTPVLHFDDINGRPLVGGKLYTYNANSSTPAPTYRNKSGSLLNENPISLDERGECEVWLVDGLRYKMVLVDPIGTQVWEADDVTSSGSGSSSLQRINIFSSDHSVDVEENYVSHTDSFNVDLGVKYENLPDKPDIHGSCLLTTSSEWQTLDGTEKILRNVWTTGTPSSSTGDKIRLAMKDGQTKYRIEVARLGAYRVDIALHVKWDETPVNKTGHIFGFAVDFSKNFSAVVGRQSNIVEVPYSQQEYYGFGFQVPVSAVDAPNGVKIAIQALVEYLGPIPEAA